MYLRRVNCHQPFNTTQVNHRKWNSDDAPDDALPTTTVVVDDMLLEPLQGSLYAYTYEGSGGSPVWVTVGSAAQ